MAQNKGTLLVSPVRPINGDLNIPVAYAEEVRGGWHSVDSISDRNLIGEGRRKFGMIVYIKNDDTFFQLKEYISSTLSDNLNWVQINLVQSGSEWSNSVLTQQGTPPISPNDGDRYLINSGTGIWTAYSKYIAEYLNSSWIYTAPTEGMTVRVDNEPGPIYVYLGGSWVKQEFVGDAQYPYYIVPGSTTLNVATGSEYLIYGDLTLNGDINNNGKVVVLNGSITGGGTISGSGLIQQINLLTDVVAGVGITISSTSSSTRTISSNIIAGTGIYLSQNGNQLDISTLPQLVSPSYVIQANEKVEVPNWKEYFIYGDLTVYGELDISDDGKVVVINGSFIAATGATVTNMGNIELYQLITAADDNLKVDITQIRYGTSGRILYESELKWVPLYGTYARVLTENSKFVYSTSSAYSTSTASSFENYMGVGASDPLKKLHIHNSGLLIDGNISEQESGLGDPNFARLVIDSESSELHSLIDARNDYGTVFHAKGNIDGGNRFPSFSVGTSSTNGLFQVNDYYGLNSFYINRTGNIGLHTLSPSFSTHIVGDLRVDLGSDATYDLLIRGTSSKLERVPHGSANQFLRIPSDGATPSWSSFSGSDSIDNTEIAFGNGIGLTSSDVFTFNSSTLNFIASTGSSINGSSRSTILGGCLNIICNSSCNSSILGGTGSIISDGSSRSSIIGGGNNLILFGSYESSIFGGKCGTINGGSQKSSIIGGKCGLITDGSWHSSIIGGEINLICNSSCNSSILGGTGSVIFVGRNSSIVGGINNSIMSSDRSSIIGGKDNIVCSSSHESSVLGGTGSIIGLFSCRSSIVGGENNIVCDNSFNSSVIGGRGNKISYNSNDSSIIGGFCNNITTSKYTSILGGYFNNSLTSNYSSILGGFYNDISTSKYSSILGGSNNNISSSSHRSSILGGCNNSILLSCMSMILSDGSCIKSSDYSSTFGGWGHYIKSSSYSNLIGGIRNHATASQYTSILGGLFNCVISSHQSSILSGCVNNVSSSCFSSIINGNFNNITSSCFAMISGNICNKIISSTSSSIQSSKCVNITGSTNTVILGVSGGVGGLTFSNRLNDTIVQDLVVTGSMSTIISSNEFFGITGTFSSPTQIVVKNGIIISIT